jgi:TetR/AcrR family transcriptional repressor of nem operon
MSEMAEKLMDLAQGRLQDAGYSGFSFRELATAVGIKNPSVHHYFPTKASMAAAVARRYADQIFENTAPREGETPAEVIERYRTVFREGIANGQMCLFGMLAAESGGIPDEVKQETGVFFRRCVDDLRRRIGGKDAEARALRVMAILEGAHIMARAYGSIDAFDSATAFLSGDSPM